MVGQGVLEMRHKKTLRLLLSVIVLASVSGILYAKRSRTITSGMWGARHIQLSVANGSATIEYDCAHGKIDGPLRINSRGRFDLRGTHRQERGGPVRLGENGGVPARYTGWTDGKTMKLTVTLVDSNTEIGTFELTRGKVGRVFKCL